MVRLLRVAVNTFPTVTGLPTEGVTVYSVICEPPSEGAVHETVADVSPGTAETPVGASGTVEGVTEAEAKEGRELPTEFLAFTVNVKGVPLVRLLKLAVKTLPTVTGLPTDGVTVYSVIAAPPFIAGAVQVSMADALLATAETSVGESGTVAGVTEAEAEEDVEGPTEFVAKTVKVTGVPLVRLLSVAVNTFPTVTGLPPKGVTVYPVIAEPPFEAGAVQVSMAEALPATAETPVGAPGTVTGVTGAEAEEGKELPIEFLATTVKVTDVPLVNPVKLVVNTFPRIDELPDDDVTVYPVIAEPPFEAGAVQVTVADALPATAETAVGEPATETGVIEAEAEEDKEGPRAFVAITVNVSDVPPVRLLKLAVSTAPTLTGLPTEGVTVYPVIAEPFEAGAAQVTVAEFVPATAETPVGAPGTVAGVTATEAAEARELPAEFIAITVNVVEVPFVNPVSVAVRILPTVSALPVDGVTLYPVIAEPPSEAGAVQVTMAEALPRTAETPVGAPATVAGVTEAEAKEAKEGPAAFVATTVNVTGVPLTNPVTLVVKTFPTVTATPVEQVTV